MAVGLSVALVVLVAGCGGSDKASTGASTEARTSPTAATAPTGTTPAKGKAKGTAQPQLPPKPSPEAAKKTEQAIKKAGTSLPIRKGSLPIQQYIEGKGAVLIARPTAKDFYCGKSLDERRAEVLGVYNAVAAKTGAQDLVLKIAPISNTTTNLKILATAQGGTVVLTKLGSGKGSC
jgi:hypothetical protein